MSKQVCYYYDCFGGGVTIPIALRPAKEDDGGSRDLILAVKDLIRRIGFWPNFSAQEGRRRIVRGRTQSALAATATSRLH